MYQYGFTKRAKNYAETVVFTSPSLWRVRLMRLWVNLPHFFCQYISWGEVKSL